MRNDANLERRNNWNSHTILKVLACSLLMLGFYAGASAASLPLQSGVSTYPLSQSSMQPATRTPTLTATRALPASIKAPKSALAPQSVPGQPTVDANTVALYHFDAPTGNNQVIDATGRYTATLNGNATVTSSGLYAGVLQLDGNGSYVRTGHFDNYSLSQGTVEAYINFDTACAAHGSYFSIISAGGEYGSNQPVLELEAQEGLQFGIFDTDHWVFADSGINPCRYLTGGGGFPFPYDPVRFHHVAGTWGPRGVEIWVDGVLHGVGNTVSNSNIEPYPYKCNPQMQFGVQGRPYNPNAPYSCPTPVMYPTMATFPPGDYTGGLPAYNTFLIGCDSGGSWCFNGSIDELRVSNVQRTYTLAVVPTNTPIPSPTPVNISGEYPVDASTIALFHFNPAPSGETWEEVSQQYRTLGGQAAIVPGGRFGTGLYLDGNGSFVNPTNLGSPIFVGTVEAWVSFHSSSSPYQQIFAVTADNRNLVMSFGASYGNLITLMVAANSVTIPVTPADLVGCWHHLAGTWGPRGLEIWLDGTLRNTNSGFTGGVPAPVSNWRVGCDYLGFCVNGWLDEVRVSSVQRTLTTAALASLRSARSPFRLGNSAALPNGTLTFLPMIQVAPTPQCPFGG